MAEEGRKLAGGADYIDFRTEPAKYRHWKLNVDGPVATQDPDGWFDTGDEGYLADGAVVVCGRRKDVIIMGGRNIYPTDIERAASAADDVRAGNAVAVEQGRLAGAPGPAPER